MWGRAQREATRGHNLGKSRVKIPDCVLKFPNAYKRVMQTSDTCTKKYVYTYCPCTSYVD